MRPLRAPRLAASFIVTFTLFAHLSSAPATARNLTFEERVAAQEAIERVYYSHQIGATRPFEEAVPREVLQRKVQTYLKQSVALERFWNTRVSAAMLQAELERIVENTNFPDRLQSLLDALGNDPVLITECVARPVLVDRLARNFFAFDSGMHAAARSEAARLQRRLVDGEVDVRASEPRRTVVELRRVSTGEVQRAEDRAWDARPDNESDSLFLDDEAFARTRRTAPEAVGEVGPVVELRGSFSITVVLAESADASTLATYTVRKTGWADWWDEIHGALTESVVGEEMLLEDRAGLVGAPLKRFGPLHRDASRWLEAEAPRATGTSTAACLLADTWDNGSLDEPVFPQARYGHTAVWTGSVMVIWGGYDGFYEDPGARYDPLTDTWTPVSTTGAPSGRVSHTAVWTGSLMVVWGGSSRGNQLDGGGRYDPVTDTWMPISGGRAPSAREGHSAVWTGSLMIVWGGVGMYSRYEDTGSRYDPVADSWAATSSVNAPLKRAGHTAVWTGSRMIVWGGGSSGFVSNAGGVYNPGSDTWTQTSFSGTPQTRVGAVAVWSGNEMIVWGGLGEDSAGLNSGGRYNPATDTWKATSTAGAPSGRAYHTAIWTGGEMVVWGGDDGDIVNTGGRYDPATDSWGATSMNGAPAERRYHSAIWTGSLMIVWGGDDGGFTNTGGRYDPARDTWTPTSTNGVAFGRGGHTAVWTGNVMIVWGGTAEGHANTGDRYDPLTDTWTPTSTIGAPSGRSEHIAVWTGSLMVVWGGGYLTHTNSGGRYDPIADIWSPTSIVDAPSIRRFPSAIWTGNLMVVWGGRLEEGVPLYSNTGGRYDPVKDTWTRTSTVGAPSGRLAHTAVWTGSVMVIWGGIDVGYANTGGRYDPESDTWLSMSTAGAPSARADHTVVWGQDTMIVWGGRDGGGLSSGGRYDPLNDTWTPTSTLYAPTPRSGHTAVWTGSLMVVWGGDSFRTGGQYDPTADRWIATSTLNTPSARAGHTAVWTGTSMIIWGSEFGWALQGGGRWTLIQGQDSDGDGHLGCVDDCDDTNPRCISDCSDADGDGYCAEFDCDDFMAVCTSDCSDSNADGVRDCVANPTLLVTTPSDDGVGSLRSAIRLAHDGDTIQFDPSLDQLPVRLTSGEVALDRSVTILGNGPTRTILDGSEMNRVLRVTGGDTSIVGVTIRNGRRELDDSGGAGVLNEADLRLTDCVVANNRDISYLGGGGILNRGVLTLTRVEVLDNFTYYGWGAAIRNNGVLALTGCSLRSNFNEWGQVGVIQNDAGGTMTITDSQINGGHCDGGTPGIRNDGTLTMIRSLLTGLKAEPIPTSTGGALLNFGEASLTACTISGNEAYWGGGVYNEGSLSLTDSTVTSNRNYDYYGQLGYGGGIVNEGALVLRNTIVASQLHGDDCTGPVESEGFNLDSDGTCALTETTDHPATNPLLGPLGDNGGAGLSHALLPGSPAIDSGSCPGSEEDQRGLARPVDVAQVPNVEDACDIGAFEVQGPVACSDRDRDGYALCDRRCDSTGATCGDCNDADAAVYPEGLEICNGADDDCNGAIDDGLGPGTVTVGLEPERLWPPNHRLVDVHATISVSEACPSACPTRPVVVLTSVTSSEADDAIGAGDGQTVNDIQAVELGTLDLDFRLRAERDGSRSGRLYQVAYTATDCFGDTVVGHASLRVPPEGSH